jgi:dihydrofolate synthase / folylpolyglutamate synthase
VMELAQILFPLFQHVIVTPVDSPRSAAVEDLLAAARSIGSAVEAATGAISAVERALQLTPIGGLVVVTGSLYLVGQVRFSMLAEPMKI